MKSCIICKAQGTVPHALNCPDRPKGIDGFTVSNLLSIEAGSDPMREDIFNMGMKLAKDVTLMFPNHPSEEARYLIIIDEKTGKRLKVTFER